MHGLLVATEAFFTELHIFQTPYLFLQGHLKHVPEYNIPNNLRKISKTVKKNKFNKKVPKVKIKKSQMKPVTKTQQKYMVKLK